MTEKFLRATHGSPDRPLKVGNLEIPCYVLEGGTRVLSGRGMQSALALGQRHGALLKGFLSKQNIKPFINDELAMALSAPVRFVRPGRGGKLAVGYEATILVDICDAILTARKKTKLSAKQLIIAAQCEILTRAFAKVGIIALVDEATGYQEIRDRLALQKILDKYLTDDWAKWTKTFPDEYYKELFRLKNVKYPMGENGRKPSYVGHWTNDIIYTRLAPGVLKELKVKAPRLPGGSRKRKFHQHLTRDYGHPELKNLLSNVMFLMKASPNWKDFKYMLNKAKPKHGDNLLLDFKD